MCKHTEIIVDRRIIPFDTNADVRRLPVLMAVLMQLKLKRIWSNSIHDHTDFICVCFSNAIEWQSELVNALGCWPYNIRIERDTFRLACTILKFRIILNLLWRITAEYFTTMCGAMKRDVILIRNGSTHIRYWFDGDGKTKRKISDIEREREWENTWFSG